MDEQSKNKGFLGDKFENFRINPDDKLWNNIRKQIVQDEQQGYLAPVFQDFIHVPHKKVWRSIESELFPGHLKVMYISLWSVAAAVLLLLGSFYIIKLNNRLPKQNADFYVTENHQEESNNDIISNDEKNSPVESAENMINSFSTDSELKIQNTQTSEKENATPLFLNEDTNKKEPELPVLNGIAAFFENTNHAWVEMKKGLNLFVTSNKRKPQNAIDFNGMLASNVTLAKAMEQDFNSPVFSETNGMADEIKGIYGYSSVYDDVEHHTPVSLGFLFNRNLTHRISLNSGIVYTRLSSLGTINNSTWRTEEQNIMHYAGIPVNISFDFLQRNKFALFIVSGLQLDYGIFEKETITEYNNEEKIDEYTIRQSINKTQASYQLGIGANHQISKQFDIYIQTNLTHFFYLSHYNQWSESKLWPSINAGVRFKL